MLTLLKYYTFAGANGTNMDTEWIRVPEGFQNWQLVVLVHSAISTTAALLQLQTSWDTTLEANIGVPQSLNSQGPFPQNIPIGMGPWIRLNLASSADSVVTISVYLTPKSD